MFDMRMSNVSIELMPLDSNRELYMSRYPLDNVQDIRDGGRTTGRSLVHIKAPFQGYEIETTFVNGKMSGETTIFNNRHVIVASVNLVDGQREGWCREYNEDGDLQFEGLCHDDVVEGIGKLYEKGVQTKLFIYRGGEPSVELLPIHRPGFFKEVSVYSGEIVAICQYTNNYERNGVCFLYQDNHIFSITEYSEGSAIHTLRSFYNDEMTVYDANQAVIYKGGYKNDFDSDYPRQGLGEEFFNGWIIYKGEFADDRRQGQGSWYSGGRKKYEGNWSKGYPSGQGQYFDNNGIEMAKGVWNRGYIKIGKEWLDYETGEKESAFSKRKLKKWKARQTEHIRSFKDLWRVILSWLTIFWGWCCNAWKWCCEKAKLGMKMFNEHYVEEVKKVMKTDCNYHMVIPLFVGLLEVFSSFFSFRPFFIIIYGLFNIAISLVYVYMGKKQKGLKTVTILYLVNAISSIIVFFAASLYRNVFNYLIPIFGVGFLVHGICTISTVEYYFKCVVCLTSCCIPDVFF